MYARTDAAAAASPDSRESVGPTLQFSLTESGPLHPFVQSFYLYRNDAPLVVGVERVDLGQIRFLLKGQGTLSFVDHNAEPSRPVMINGPGLAASAYSVEGPFHCFGVSLRAIGWRSLIGLPAHEVTNRVLDGVEIFGPEALEVLERLRTLDSLDEMIAAVSPMLIARRRKVPRSHLALARAVREWAATENPTIESLYQMLPMGERQATRLCNEYYGGPPKHLERKFRAIRAAIRIANGASNAEAAEYFADQSHMIKDIKHFTGHTPSDLRDDIDPVVAATFATETFHFLPDVIPESVDPDDL